MPNTIKCPICNTDNLEDTMKCSKCGIALADEVIEETISDSLADDPTGRATTSNNSVSALEVACVILGLLQILGAFISMFVFDNSFNLPFGLSAIVAIAIGIGSLIYFAVASSLKKIREQAEYIEALHNKIDTLIEKQK